MKTLAQKIQEYQDDHDIDDETMVRILCEAIEAHANEQVQNDISQEITGL